jgi:hypothetical protein
MDPPMKPPRKQAAKKMMGDDVMVLAQDRCCGVERGKIVSV